jgi:hypothetical protein
MMTRQYRNLIVAFLLTLSAHAQESKPAAAAFAVRSYLHDPTHPAAELYLRDASGDLVKLSLASMELGKAQQTVPVDGSLLLYNTASVDPKKPGPSIAASATVPKDMKRAIVIIVPAPANSKPAYRMVMIDDSLAAFPKGESRILGLVPLETAMEVGEHKLPCKPGAITPVPPVKTLDPYNMAQTNFFYKKNGSWIAFSECRMKYIDEFRQIFIVHGRPGGTAPELTTLIDQIPRTAPAK